MNGTQIARAIAAVAVLMVILFVVSGWLRDYREAGSPRQTPASSPTTPTADTTPTAEPDDDEDADESSAEPSSPTVVVLIEGLNFRATPDADGRRLGGLNRGDRLELIKTEGGWHQVKSDSGTEGWVSANSQYTRVEGR